jgi:hypothetical protein
MIATRDANNSQAKKRRNGKKKRKKKELGQTKHSQKRKGYGLKKLSSTPGYTENLVLIDNLVVYTRLRREENGGKKQKAK